MAHASSGAHAQNEKCTGWLPQGLMRQRGPIPDLCEGVKGCNPNPPFGGHPDTHTHTHTQTHTLQNPATQSVRFTSVKRSNRKENTTPLEDSRCPRPAAFSTRMRFPTGLAMCAERCVFRVPQNTRPLASAATKFQGKQKAPWCTTIAVLHTLED